MSFLNGLTVLLVYQLVGELTVLLLKIPVPGPVIGMMLLFLTLFIQEQFLGQRPKTWIKSTADSLLQHLSLLFVPAGVGVIVHFERINQEWLPISIALVLSTVITLAVTAIVMRFTLRLFSSRLTPDV